MKRFYFQLQTALEWRRRRMDLEQARLTGLEARKQELTSAMSDLQKSWRDSRELVLSSPAINATDLAALEIYRHSVDRQQHRLEGEMARLAGAIAAQQKKLLEASREFRLLEKLQQRRFAEWRRAAEAELESEAGELYLAKWAQPDEGLE
jgi:flagellar export protein FliJ